LYRRIGDESRFQPCATTVPLVVDGNWNGQFMLREQFRWNSVIPGQKLFGVFTGWILRDTVRAGAARWILRPRACHVPGFTSSTSTR
jgi:hypothetical protein